MELALRLAPAPTGSVPDGEAAPPVVDPVGAATPVVEPLQACSVILKLAQVILVLLGKWNTMLRSRK